MKKLKLFVTVCLVAIMATGCSLFNKDETIITINDKAITQKDFDAAFEAVASKQMFGKLGVDLKKDSNSVLNLMLKERVVNELIVKKLLDEKIAERKITVTDKEIDEAVKKVTEQVGSKEKLEEVLKQQGITMDQLRKDLAEEQKMMKLVDSLSLVAIGESEAKKFYDENKKNFEFPDKVRASHILISANPAQLKEVISAKEENKNKKPEEIDKLVQEDMDKKLKAAEEILAKVNANKKEFAKIAKEKSDDTISALQGGDLGYFTKEEMVKEFSDAAFSMKPGTISAIIKTQYGYHIIYVTDRIAAGVTSFDKAKQEIIDYLQMQEKMKILQENVENMRKTAKIKYVKEEYNPEKIQEKIKTESAKLQQQQADKNQAAEAPSEPEPTPEEAPAEKE